MATDCIPQVTFEFCHYFYRLNGKDNTMSSGKKSQLSVKPAPKRMIVTARFTQGLFDETPQNRHRTILFISPSHASSRLHGF